MTQGGAPLALPSYPPRRGRSPLDRSLASLVRSLRASVHAAGAPSRIERSGASPSQRREAACSAVNVLLVRFAAVRAAIGERGSEALCSFAEALAGAIDRKEPAAFRRGHDTLLSFADWLDGERQKPPRLAHPRWGRRAGARSRQGTDRDEADELERDTADEADELTRRGAGGR